MSAVAPRTSLGVAATARTTEDVVVGQEIVRHRLSSRAIHWTVASFFFLSLLSGLPIWTPIFGWMAALFGGLSVCRWLHPWAGLLFFVASLVDVPSLAARHAPAAAATASGCGRRRSSST